MILGKVVGSVVATRKSSRLEGFKLLVVVPMKPDGKISKNYVVAVDAVGAGAGETVLTVSGSSAREDKKTVKAATDTTIIAVVDEIEYTPVAGGMRKR